ncbi:hypothetical protein BGZ92_010768 [Podila epicladia]|nr:hypothetical protein BGZ92_010768 [Podila epicladia]
MTDTHLTLFCPVDGEATSNAFSVEIVSTKRVEGLKKLIMAAKAPRFDDIAADELSHWPVSISITDDDERPILLNFFDEKKNLGPATRLSKVYSENMLCTLELL